MVILLISRFVACVLEKERGIKKNEERKKKIKKDMNKRQETFKKKGRKKERSKRRTGMTIWRISAMMEAKS